MATTMAARALLSSRLAGLMAARNCGRRTYGAAAADVVARKEPVMNVAGKARQQASVAAAAVQAPRQECSWMRDPKTGCWMPENHVDDVDPADLRARLLFSEKE